MLVGPATISGRECVRTDVQQAEGPGFYAEDNIFRPETESGHGVAFDGITVLLCAISACFSGSTNAGCLWRQRVDTRYQLEGVPAD